MRLCSFEGLFLVKALKKFTLIKTRKFNLRKSHKYRIACKFNRSQRRIALQTNAYNISFRSD